MLMFYIIGVLFNFIGIFILIGKLSKDLPKGVYVSLILRSFMLVYLLGLACIFANIELLEESLKQGERDDDNL